MPYFFHHLYILLDYNIVFFHYTFVLLYYYPVKCKLYLVEEYY